MQPINHGEFIMNWNRASTLNELEENQITEVSVSGKNLCLLKRGGTVYAFPATCPHAGAKLCEGWLDAKGGIVCPLHQYHFDPENGRNTSGEGYKLKSFPVEVRGTEVYVCF